MEFTYIGVDPGKSGGICVFHKTGYQELIPMPEDLDGLWHLIQRLCLDIDVLPGQTVPARALIEKVHSFTNKGRKQGAAGMFKFGQTLGHLEACFTAAGIPWKHVTAQAWQKGLDVPIVKGQEYAFRKKKLHRFAKRLFPTLPIPKELADCLLICEHNRRDHVSSL